MAVTASWQFLLTDLAGIQLGELTGASDRTVSLPLLRMPTAGFKIPMWHYLAETLTEQETLLQCWRTDVLNTKRLVFNGPVRGVNEQSDNTTQTVSATAAGPWTRLASRLVGTSRAGIQFPASGEEDLGNIARSIVTTVNGQEFTGISLGTWAASQNGATGKWYFKNAAEALAEISTGLNSYEFEVAPTIPTAVGGVGGWPQIGLFNVKPLIGGTTRADAIFEYGTTRANASGYERAVSRDGLLTKGYISVNGWPDSTAQEVLSKEDAAARTARGLYEAMVPDAGILDDGLRQKVVDYHVDIRKQPRQQITFKLATNARPSALTDFEVGDFVRARAVVRDSVRFDATFRVWGVTFNIDGSGNETNELELILP